MCAYYFALALVRFFQMTQRGAETKREEMQPEIRPTAIGMAKLLSEESPKNSATTIIITTARKVVTVVIIVRDFTLLTAPLTRSAVESL